MSSSSACSCCGLVGGGGGGATSISELIIVSVCVLSAVFEVDFIWAVASRWLMKGFGSGPKKFLRETSETS